MEYSTLIAVQTFHQTSVAENDQSAEDTYYAKHGVDPFAWPKSKFRRTQFLGANIRSGYPRFRVLVKGDV